MLVLTRKKNEVLHIGEDINITIIRIAGDSVRIGIEAPRNTRITRKEITHRNIETSTQTDASFDD